MLGAEVDDTSAALSSCDPTLFYNKSSFAEDIDDIQAYISYGSTAFVIVFSPLLIASPFMIRPLNTLCRQIVAMVVLSDLVCVLAGVFDTLFNSKWEQRPLDPTFFCSLVNFLISATYLWSPMWLVTFTTLQHDGKSLPIVGNLLLQRW